MNQDTTARSVRALTTASAAPIQCTHPDLCQGPAIRKGRGIVSLAAVGALGAAAFAIAAAPVAAHDRPVAATVPTSPPVNTTARMDDPPVEDLECWTLWFEYWEKVARGEAAVPPNC